MVLPFRNNPLHLGIHGNYLPVGKPVIVPVDPKFKRSNPIKTDLSKEYGPTWAARFFVGLSVGGRDTYSLEYLIQLVRSYLRSHGMKENSSFIAQKGVYTHEQGKRKGLVVQENSAQVVIIYEGAPEFKQFVSRTGFCVKLAEHLCKKMDQETVIVDIQENGLSKYVWSVSA
jgi:hypothetical protein